MEKNKENYVDVQDDLDQWEVKDEPGHQQNSQNIGIPAPTADNQNAAEPPNHGNEDED